MPVVHNRTTEMTKDEPEHSVENSLKRWIHQARLIGGLARSKPNPEGAPSKLRLSGRFRPSVADTIRAQNIALSQRFPQPQYVTSDLAPRTKHA